MTISLLPRCDTCGVEYVENYEGPCQEPRGTYNESTGWSSVCPGAVSWRATAVVLHEREAQRQRDRAYKVELFRGRDRTRDPRSQRTPGA